MRWNAFYYYAYDERDDRHITFDDVNMAYMEIEPTNKKACVTATAQLVP